jgi:outer membrane immunogenic protein
MTRAHFALIFSALVVSTAPAVADGMDACTGGRFAGTYIGATVGYVDLDADQSELGSPNISGSDETFAAGIVSGFNKQCGRWVFGIESDTSFTDLEANSAFPDPVFITSKIDYFGTLRARVGVVHDNRALFYVTGGLAYANVDHIVDDPVNDFYDSREDLEFGWTLGGGIELACNEKWTFRAEGLYVDLGEHSEDYVLHATACGGGPCTADMEYEDKFWVGRLAVTYKFGREEAAPLK